MSEKWNDTIPGGWKGILNFIFWVFVVGSAGIIFIFLAFIFEMITFGRGKKLLIPIYKWFHMA